jgi:membrane-associated phospholipid phosphatase
MEWEVRLIEWIQNNLESTGRIAGGVLAFIGGEKGLVLLLVVVLFCWKKETGQKLALLIAAVIAWFAMIKAVAKRPRPYTDNPDRVSALAPADPDAPATDLVAQGYSFPSMHSGSIAASYFTLARDVKKKWFWIAVTVLTLLVGYSRIVTGNHYPTDVLAGWILGFAVMGIFDLLEKRVQKEGIRHLILLAVTLPGLFYVRTAEYYTALGLLIGAVAAIPFERKYVNYQDTRNKWAMILRVLGAFVIYFGLNTILKMPFSEAFLGSANMAAFLVRTARYAVIMFVIMGVYPKAFVAFEKVGNKRA